MYKEISIPIVKILKYTYFACTYTLRDVIYTGKKPYLNVSDKIPCAKELRLSASRGLSLFMARATYSAHTRPIKSGKTCNHMEIRLSFASKL